MHLIQILLPITVDDPHGGKTLGEVRDTLAERFSGVTLYRNAPAEGLWKDEGAIEADTIVVAEVMTEHLDREWWAGYRRELERQFDKKRSLSESWRPPKFDNFARSHQTRSMKGTALELVKFQYVTEALTIT